MMIRVHAITWENLDALIKIRRLRLKDNDLTLSISSGLLIENQSSNRTVKSNLCLFMLSLFDKKCIL